MSFATGRRSLRNIDHRKLVDDQPVKTNIFDGLPKLIEVDWLLNIAIRSQPVAIHQVAFLFGGCQYDDRYGLGARVGLEPLQHSDLRAMNPQKDDIISVIIKVRTT